MTGWGICSRDQAMPITMPMMMGLVTSFRSAPKMAVPSNFSPASRVVRERAATAATLYRGTAPMIISVAASELPYRFSRKATPKRAVLLR